MDMEKLPWLRRCEQILPLQMKASIRKIKVIWRSSLPWLNTTAFTQHLSAAEQEIKLATLAPRETSYDKALRRMGQAWQKLSLGTVELVV